MVQEEESGEVGSAQVLDIEQVKRRLDMLDHRLDDIDSMVTAIAERVLRQPVSFKIACPHCGKNIEIALIGSEKPTG